MRKLIGLFLVVAMWACGEEVQAPVACSTVEDQSLYTGETLDVDICFVDPEGGGLKYTATSSNANVTTSVRGESVIIEALAPGQATVTVTATSASGLMAEEMFNVTVPNRDPILVKDLSDILVVLDREARIDLSSNFEDEDGEELLFTATSGDLSIVTVSVEGPILTVGSVNLGRTTVSITASDVSGGSVTVMVPAEVTEGGWLFFDGFESMQPHWEPFEATGFDVADGAMHVWPTDPNFLGAIAYTLSEEVYEWTVETSVVQTVDDTSIGIYGWSATLETVDYLFYLGLGLFSGNETDFRLAVYDPASPDEDKWIRSAVAIGTVGIEVGEVYTAKLGVNEHGQVWASVKDTTMIGTDLPRIKFPIAWTGLAANPFNSEGVEGRISSDWFGFRGIARGSRKALDPPKMPKLRIFR